jgi:hypothetical protein
MSKSNAEYLTVAQAAARLGVSPRAVQKRCANGTLAARRVSTPAGDRWEVQDANLDASRTRTREPMGREPEREPDAVSRSEPREPTREQGANLDANSRTIGREPDANEPTRETELREEVKFLRSLLEARDRDAAELRAALREALRLAPKQLTEGGVEAAQDVPTAQDTITTTVASGDAVRSTQREKMKPWQRAVMRIIGAR